MKPKLTKQERQLLEHATGWRSKQPLYRNYFSADPDSEAYREWRALESRGLAVCLKQPDEGGFVGPLALFKATKLGIEALSSNKTLRDSMQKQKKFIFRIEIGDTSGDGHGKSNVFMVEANKDIHAVRATYLKVAEMYPVLNPETFMCEYEDSSLPKEVYLKAKELGYDFLPGKDLEGDELDQELHWPDVSHETLVEYTMWFIGLGDSTLEMRRMKYDEVPTLHFSGKTYDDPNQIGYIGYGLF